MVFASRGATVNVAEAGSVCGRRVSARVSRQRSGVRPLTWALTRVQPVHVPIAARGKEIL
jgi:hypothetical protein